ncbi:MAG: peptidoglycan DD-metalloendopeptidase family protein [Actinobacteria bacterium]|nr:peptidoglycan DD-metalloendopeptidase family protein [Actinomycetota bacterium]
MRRRLFPVVVALVCGGCLNHGGAGAPRATGGAVVAPAGGTARDVLCGVPIDAPLLDGFRPPAERWLPGNRGLTFASTPGTVVRAVRAGVVTFAGRIAHQGYVTTRLDDGRDVTYSYLGEIAVRPGDRVETGAVIAVAGDTAFHLGYRSGTDYLDPVALVFDACHARHAVLVEPPRADQP